MQGMRWRIWLSHCWTSRKVAGSIPDSVTLIFLPAALYTGVNLASNRNEYQEYFLGAKDSRCVGLTTLPTSSADCLQIWDPQPPGTLGACNGIALLLLSTQWSRVNQIIRGYYLANGQGWLSRYSDSLRAGRSGEGEIFRTRPDRSLGPPNLLCNGNWVSRRVKAAETWRWPHTPYSADVKEIIEVYLKPPMCLCGLFKVNLTFTSTSECRWYIYIYIYIYIYCYRNLSHSQVSSLSCRF